VLIGAIAVAVVVLVVIVAVAVRRRSYDDVHSVEHYHRQMHTLEEMQTHPSSTPQESGNGEAVYPASAVRTTRSPTVRLTESDTALVPPVPPPPVANPGEPVKFEDETESVSLKSSFMVAKDRAMKSVNHRPRRFAGPLVAIAIVAILVVVLIVTGVHSKTTPRHAGASHPATTVTSAPHHPATATHHATSTTTTTTAPPAVSAPVPTSPRAATYHVAAASYSLSLAATTNECWVQATNTANGAVLFSGTLLTGQSHTMTATGPTSVIAGAPGSFAATVNGMPVTLPAGYQSPLTLTFQPPTL
jgi:hypothetical protein